MKSIRYSLILLLVWITAAPAFAASAARSVDAVGMTVSDMDHALGFYTRVLPFERVSDIEVTGSNYEHLEGIFGLRMRVVRLRLGNESLVLTQFLVPRGRPFPADSRSNDQWFQHIAIVVSDMDRAYAYLRENHVEYASTEPQTLPAWNRNAAGIRAFYFRDPDGHYLELIQFPPGKGDPRWQRSNGKLFLGIDHSAIVVTDTGRSVAFYRDLLGFHVAGTSENWGSEQEHLNNVFGAHLRITTMRSDSGPGVELLEYLAPRDGRPIVADLHPNDLCFWQLMINGPVPSIEKDIKEPSAMFPNHELGFSRAALTRDPDNHALELIER